MNITTIVAIVAFAALLIICAIIISAWRRGNKARNASIKAIEQRVNDVVLELSEMNTTWKNTYERMDFERRREEEKRAAEIEKIIEKELEPLKTAPKEEISLDFADGEISLDFDEGEISLDFMDFEEFDNITIDDIELFDSTPEIQTVYNTGRSGKTYTAEELESLIKE